MNLPKNWNLKQSDKGYFELYTGQRRPFSVSFPENPPLRHQPLVKAVGFRGKPLVVWDVTAGWAQDAFLLALLGCIVTAIEKQDLVFFLIKEGLSSLKPLKRGSLRLIHDNSINYLNNTSEKPEVICMDPLFSKEKKSLSRKPLRILQTLAQENETETEKLFQECLKKAGKRVVVKRHRLQPALKGPLLCSFKGRAVCYDVFSPVG